MERWKNFIGIGVLFWISAAVFMHFVGPLVFDGGFIHALFWLANFLAPLLFLPVIAKFTGRTKADMVIPCALMAIPVMLMDGLAVTFDALGKTHIYADTPLLAAYTGGFLLFAIWSFFFWALIWHRKA